MVSKCPICGLQNSLVIDTRNTYIKTYSFIRRRRECQSCGNRWSTIEVPLEIGQKLIKIADLIKEINL